SRTPTGSSSRRSKMHGRPEPQRPSGNWWRISPASCGNRYSVVGHVSRRPTTRSACAPRNSCVRGPSFFIGLSSAIWLIAENRGQSDDRDSLSYEKPIKPLERRGAFRSSGLEKIGGQRGNRTPTAKGG